MRHTASVTSLNWIPSEAVSGLNTAAFGAGFVHDDDGVIVDAEFDGGREMHG